MNTQNKGLLITVVLALGLTGCASVEQKLTEAGATRLYSDQVAAYIIGNTEKWSKGGGYYKADGTMEAVWEGVKTNRTYTISDDGEVCIKHSKTFCHFYMNDHGKIVMIESGRNAGVKKMLVGNQLSAL